MVDQHFNEVARQRKAASLRAQFTPSGDRIIYLDAPLGPGPGEISAKWLREQLPPDGSPVVLQIHCEGGSVFEGFAMLDVLASYPGRVRAIVSSMALSMGSVLLCACDEVELTENSHVMLHSPHMGGERLDDSDRALLDSLNERMVDIYAKRTRKPAGEIRRAMQAETWMNATEAVRFGMADRIVDPAKRASAKSTRRVVAKATPKQSATARWRSAVDALAATMPRAKAIMEVEKSHPGLRQQYLAEVNKR